MQVKAKIANNCDGNKAEQLHDNNNNSNNSENIQNMNFNNTNNNNENPSHADDADIYAHYEPKVRLLRIRKTVTDACGFHLTRTKWDPYPWVNVVDAHTPAEMSGLKIGDCILEVNGEDVLGLRITDVAKLVKAKPGHVTLLLWSSGCDLKCDPESLCCAPMPRSLQRLSIIVQSILAIIECPVCLDTIPPPAMQCQNGHLLCVNCRILAEKCPVCRDRYTPRRALIAEQIYTAITNAYNLCRNEDKLREKLFGQLAVRRNMRDRTKDTPSTNDREQLQRKQKSKRKTKMWQKENQHVALEAAATTAGQYTARKSVGERNEEVGGVVVGGVEDSEVNSTPALTSTTKNKFLTKLWLRKAYSMGNLAKASSSASCSGARTATDTTNGRALTADNGAMNPTMSDAAAAATMKIPTTMARNTASKNHDKNGAATKTTMQLFSNRSRIDSNDDEGDGADSRVNAMADGMTVDDYTYNTANVGVANGTMKNSKNHLTSMHNSASRNANAASSDKLKKSTTTCTSITNPQALSSATTMSVAHVAALSRACATTTTTTTTTTNDLLQIQHGQQQQQLQLQPIATTAQTQIQLTATRTTPLQRLPNVFNGRRDNDNSNNGGNNSISSSSSTNSSDNNNGSSYNDSKSNNSIESLSTFRDKSSALLLLSKRRPTCHKRRSAAIECSHKQFALSTDANDNDNDFEAVAVADANANANADADCSLTSSSRNTSLRSSNRSSLQAPIITAASTSHSPTSSRSSSSGVCIASIDSSDLAVSADATTHNTTAINNTILSLSPMLVDASDNYKTSSNNNSKQCTISKDSSSISTTFLLTMDGAQQAVATPVGAIVDAAAITLTSAQLHTPLRCITPTTCSTSSYGLGLNGHRSQFRCPCDCGESFNATEQLQRHVKVVHGLPIVCFGGASARLVLPLQQPVDNAVLILEIHNERPHNASDDACEMVATQGIGIANNEIDDKCNMDNKAVNDSRTAQQQQQRQPHNECRREDSKECWIRIKAQGDCIRARALWQAAKAMAGADYVLEMRLNVKDALVELQLKEL